jgi:hypothetical protein
MSVSGSVQCLGCPEGKYQNEKGKQLCKRCPGAKIPNEPKRTSCVSPDWEIPSDCEQTEQYLDATSSNRDDWKCIACPRGGHCDYESQTGKDHTVLTKKENWRVPQDYYTLGGDAPVNPNREYIEFLNCPFPGRCLGDRSGSDSVGDSVADTSPSSQLGSNVSSSSMLTPCTEGTDTNHPLCAVCALKWTKEGLGPCTRCGAGVILEKWAILFVVAGMVLLAGFACRRTFKKKLKKLRLLWKDLLRVAAVLVTFCQISNSVPSVVQIRWRKCVIIWLCCCAGDEAVLFSCFLSSLHVLKTYLL